MSRNETAYLTMAGNARFPVVFAGTDEIALMTIDVTEQPIMGVQYVEMRPVVNNPFVNIHYAACIVATRQTHLITGEQSAISEEIDKNALYSLTEAVDFATQACAALIVANKMPRQTVFLALHWSRRSIEDLVGSSLGLATAVSLMGFFLHTVPVAFTGFVDTTGGNPGLAGIEVLASYLIQPIDNAFIKLIGCVRQQCFLFLPEKNRLEISRGLQTDRNGRHRPYMPALHIDGQHVVKQNVTVACFVNTMKDVVQELRKMGLSSGLVNAIDQSDNIPSVRRYSRRL